MGKKYDFDYIIIGAGPAGNSTALNLAKNTKKRIAIVSKSSCIGGSFLKIDIPYSINLGFAHELTKIHRCPAFGSQNLHYNLPTLISHQTKVVDGMRKEYKDTLATANITLLDGQAYFLNPHTITVGKQQYTADTFVIATGSQPKTGGIVGLDHTEYLTPESVVSLRRLPDHVLVIGGGATGCEIAAYFAELGSKVILMEREERLLPKEDSDISAALAEYFTKHLGITVATGAKAVALEQHGAEKHLTFAMKGQEKTARVDCVVLATGSEPALDFGLENAKVKYKPSGILVNRLFQTTTKNIYAIGDCLGDEVSSAERVEYQASVLSSNFINKNKIYPKYSGFIRRINISPEVAIVGKTELKLIKNKRKYATATVHLQDLPASRVSGDNYGFIKVTASHTGRLIGGIIFAPNASLIAEELVLAVRGHLTVFDLANAPHPDEHFNIAIKIATKNLFHK